MAWAVVGSARGQPEYHTSGHIAGHPTSSDLELLREGPAWANWGAASVSGAKLVLNSEW